MEEMSLSINTENCKSKRHRGITAHGSEWPLVKTLEIISAGECVEKGEPTYMDAGNIN